ncbi:MAG: hypothetical protein AB7W59_00430 [Acidimicrobiia bacterium]
MRTHTPKYAFTALNACRANERNAAKTHMVKSVNKDGSVSKMAPTELTWKLDAFGGEGAEAKAEARKAELERLNPGRRFVVVAL